MKRETARIILISFVVLFFGALLLLPEVWEGVLKGPKEEKVHTFLISPETRGLHVRGFRVEGTQIERLRHLGLDVPDTTQAVWIVAIRRDSAYYGVILDDNNNVLKEEGGLKLNEEERGKVASILSRLGLSRSRWEDILTPALINENKNK